MDTIKDVNSISEIFLFLLWLIFIFQSQFKHFSFKRGVYLFYGFFDVCVFYDKNLFKVGDVKGVIWFVW